MQIRLATRGSRLALAQSGMIADALRRLGAEVELVTVRTAGDVSTASLSSLGGAGVFAAAVREAVLGGDCDLAVHSLKDVPTTPCPGLVLAAVPEREDPRDALCARDGLGLWALPRGARVGTGSPRRAAQLRALRDDLEIVDIRGNVDTRLGRVGTDLDAVVLAAAGLNRIGRGDAITEPFDPEIMLPAPAQGALGIECREDDHALRALLARLDHAPTRAAVEAERDLMRLVEAGCAAPFGALGVVTGGPGGAGGATDRSPDTKGVVADPAAPADGASSLLSLRARIATSDGVTTLTRSGPVAEASRLVADLARDLAPLAGMRVLMPPSALAGAIGVRGARMTTVRLTTQRGVEDPRLGGCLDDLAAGRYDWLALTSSRTLHFLEEAGVDLVALLPEGTRVAAVGPTTAAAARASGLRVDLLPTGGSGGAGLAAAFPEPSGRVLIPGAAEPASGLDHGLRARGWRIDRVAVYRTEPADQVPADVGIAWPAGFDVFVATAPSVVAAAHRLLGTPMPPLVAIGPTTADAAARLGVEVAAIAAEPTATGLVNALVTLRKEAR